MHIRKKHKIVFFGALILAMPIVGYAATRIAVSLLPMDQDAAVMFAGLFVASILLSIPYLMLKALFHNAHLAKGERELHLRDLPDHAQENYIARKTTYTTIEETDYRNFE